MVFIIYLTNKELMVAKDKNKLNNKLITPFNSKIKYNFSIISPNSPLSRNLKTVVKTAKHRKISSTLWLQRQLNDIYVKKAHLEGYLSRAAYKLIEINQKFQLIKPNLKVVDLGAAPGGWSQVISKKIGPKGLLVAIDLLDLRFQDSNTKYIKGDFLSQDIVTKIKDTLKTKPDLIFSDMAPNTSGSTDLDHLRIVNLIEATLNFTYQILNKGGSLVIKVFQGGLEPQLFNTIKSKFKQVKYFKPQASRKESKEVYLIAQYFEGNIN